MTLRQDVESEVDGTLNVAWTVRDAMVIPTTETVLLGGGGAKLTPALLYSDLADSTELVSKFDRRIGAKVVKAFLNASCRVVRENGGHIRSFDGDRVMGVFLEGMPCTQAAKAALQINWAMRHVLWPKISTKYPGLVTAGFKLAHCVGIDTSEVLVVRGGVHTHNDLVWIGRAPNVAAKLAALRVGLNRTFITSQAYARLNDSSKLGGDPLVNMWVRHTWNHRPLDEVEHIYGSTWEWKL